jgi:hypothetical protein
LTWCAALMTGPLSPAHAQTGALEPPPMALYLGHVPRQLWNVPCTAHRTNGGRCQAWSMRGQFTCWAHGGASPQARARGEYRIWHERLDQQTIRAFQQMNVWLHDHEAVSALGTATLREIEAQLPPRRRRRSRLG